VVYWNRNLISSQEHLPSASGTSGVYDLTSQQIYTSESQWPGSASSSGGGSSSGIVSSGLLMHLDAGNSSSYSGTGTTWSDLSGNGNHATLINGPTYSSADGGALDFDGSNDYATASLLMPSRPYTASVWINHDFMSDFFQYYLNQLYSSSSTNYGFSLFRSIPFGSSPYRVEFRDRVLNSGLVTTYSTTAMSVGNWFNLCGVASTTDFKIYVNGTLEGTSTNSTSRAGSYGSLFIGSTGTNRHFNGKISSVLVYNQALSATEVTQNFNAIKSRYGL
tara:strand:+ start:343 stop:1173 length:831 start_codon:yes stop_codon:yes gene_type:complete